MKVLVLTYHYLAGSGGGIFASRGFINALCEIYGSLTLVCPVRQGKYPAGIDSRVTIVPVEDRRSRAKKYFDFLRGQFTPFKQTFETLLNKDRYDLIVFDNSNASSGLIHIAKTKSKVITIHHNWQFAYEKDNETWPRRLISAHWVWMVERKAVIESDLNITLTEQDKESLYKAYDKGRSSHIEVCPPFEYQ